VALACETCGLGQRGDRDGGKDEHGNYRPDPAAKDWDGKTFAVVVSRRVFVDGRELTCTDCINDALAASTAA
jgi:hypothetical protein